MKEERWKGYIKTYEGGTFMECEIVENMDYENISSIIQKQKQFIANLVKSMTFNEKIWDGLDIVKLKEEAIEKDMHPSLLIPGLSNL